MVSCRLSARGLYRHSAVHIAEMKFNIFKQGTVLFSRIIMVQVRIKCFIVSWGCLACIVSPAAAQEPQLLPRTAYSVPLAKLSVSFSDSSHTLTRVRIQFEGSDDQIIIAPVNDEYQEITRTGRKKTIYRESWESSWQITEFERDQLSAVISTLVSALEQFERDLQKEHWGRSLYLDGYLPRFLRGFYYLCEAARNGHDALPRVARIPESAFDVSLNSPKSDERITQWRTTPDHVLKLRIATRELIFQFRKWQKESRKKRAHDPEFFFDNRLKQAYSLFIRIYFNLKPPPKVTRG